jgi:hypothetical protein
MQNAADNSRANVGQPGTLCNRSDCRNLEREFGWASAVRKRVAEGSPPTTRRFTGEKNGLCPVLSAAALLAWDRHRLGRFCQARECAAAPNK